MVVLNSSFSRDFMSCFCNTFYVLCSYKCGFDVTTLNVAVPFIILVWGVTIISSHSSILVFTITNLKIFPKKKRYSVKIKFNQICYRFEEFLFRSTGRKT